MQGDERIEAIQSNAKAERDAVIALDSKIKDAELKKLLKERVTFILDDVESLMIPHALKAINATGEAMWIQLAEAKLKEAREKRHALEMDIAKYGGPEKAVRQP